jgi:lipopolysaccharide export system permease protein
MNLIDRYVIRAVLGGVFAVLAVLVALGALFLFANQQDDIGIGTYTAIDAFWFVLLNLPQQVFELMPIAVLLGAWLGLGTLARGSELTVMRSAGISVWRIAGSVAMAGMLLVVVAVVCGEFLAPPMQDMAKRQKALSKFSNISFASRGGAWVRDGNLLINVMQQSGRAEFGGMRIYELTPEHQLASVATASTASVQPDGSWKLTRYATTRFGGEEIQADHLASREFVSAVGGDFLGLTVVQPNDLETRVLVGLVRHSRTMGSMPPARSSPLVASRAPPRSCSPPCSRCRSCSAACARRCGRTPAQGADRRSFLRAARARERHGGVRRQSPGVLDPDRGDVGGGTAAYCSNALTRGPARADARR